MIMTSLARLHISIWRYLEGFWSWFGEICAVMHVHSSNRVSTLLPYSPPHYFKISLYIRNNLHARCWWNHPLLKGSPRNYLKIAIYNLHDWKSLHITENPPHYTENPPYYFCETFVLVLNLQIIATPPHYYADIPRLRTMFVHSL